MRPDGLQTTVLMVLIAVVIGFLVALLSGILSTGTVCTKLGGRLGSMSNADDPSPEPPR